MPHKPKSPQVPLNVDLLVDVSEALDSFCKRYKIRKKAAVELALRKFLREWAAKVPG